MAHGGKRIGAGRKPGSHTAAQLAAMDVAANVLGAVDQVAIWKKLLRSRDQKLVLDVMKYLTDRAHGKPTQRQEVHEHISVAEILAASFRLDGQA